MHGSSTGATIIDPLSRIQHERGKIHEHDWIDPITGKGESDMNSFANQRMRKRDNEQLRRKESL